MSRMHFTRAQTPPGSRGQVRYIYRTRRRACHVTRLASTSLCLDTCLCLKREARKNYLVTNRTCKCLLQAQISFRAPEFQKAQKQTQQTKKLWWQTFENMATTKGHAQRMKASETVGGRRFTCLSCIKYLLMARKLLFSSSNLMRSSLLSAMLGLTEASSVRDRFCTSCWCCACVGLCEHSPSIVGAAWVCTCM